MTTCKSSELFIARAKLPRRQTSKQWQREAGLLRPKAIILFKLYIPVHVYAIYYIFQHYKCQKGQNVIDIALGKYVGTPGIDTRDIFYLGLTYNLVKFVQRMHSHQWLLRDLCGYSIFVDPTTLTVCIR